MAVITWFGNLKQYLWSRDQITSSRFYHTWSLWCWNWEFTTVSVTFATTKIPAQKWYHFVRLNHSSRMEPVSRRSDDFWTLLLLLVHSKNSFSVTPLESDRSDLTDQVSSFVEPGNTTSRILSLESRDWHHSNAVIERSKTVPLLFLPHPCCKSWRDAISFKTRVPFLSLIYQVGEYPRYWLETGTIRKLWLRRTKWYHFWGYSEHSENIHNALLSVHTVHALLFHHKL